MGQPPNISGRPALAQARIGIAATHNKTNSVPCTTRSRWSRRRPSSPGNSLARRVAKGVAHLLGRREVGAEELVVLVGGDEVRDHLGRVECGSVAEKCLTVDLNHRRHRPPCTAAKKQIPCITRTFSAHEHLGDCIHVSAFATESSMPHACFPWHAIASAVRLPHTAVPPTGTSTHIAQQP